VAGSGDQDALVMEGEHLPVILGQEPLMNDRCSVVIVFR
jgi:hypothetical protein